MASSSPSSPCVVDNGVVSVIDLKRELVRLQHENTLLKINRKQSDDEKLPLLQAMYDDTSQQNKQLRNECRLANQRILQLEAELKESQQEEKTSAGQASIKELNDQLQLEKGLRLSESAEKDRLGLELKHLKSVLFEALAHKDQEYDELEEKYRKCLDKARCLAKSLDCVDLASNVDESDSVRRKLTHKAAVGGGAVAAAAVCTAETIGELEKHFKRAKLQRDDDDDRRQFILHRQAKAVGHP
ncbi:Protein Hook 3 [Sarracenia purpurea var. burkii]